MYDLNKKSNDEIFKEINILSQNHEIIKNEILRIVEESKKDELQDFDQEFLNLNEILKKIQISWLELVQELKHRK